MALGRTLHLQTLAEGIEGQAQLAMLRREHCDEGQGFLYSRPLAPDAVERFLDSSPAAVAPAPPVLGWWPAFGAAGCVVMWWPVVC